MYIYVYSVANNSILKHWIISSVSLRNRWSCLDILNEIIFVKDKLNAVGYQEMLHGELLPFITEIFQRDNAVIYTATTRKKCF